MGENKTLEFKESLPKNDSIAKTAVAFSNTSGGKLIIGITDKREIIGIDDENIYDLQDKIASIIFDSCSPNILPEIYTLNIDGKLLLVIEFFRGNLMPYYIKKEGKNNGTYLRVGATNRTAEFDHIIELERQKRHISYDEEANYDVALNSLNLEPIKIRFEKLGKTLDTEKLHNLRLLKTEHNITYPTNALLILLGLFENCTIKCAKFKGTTMEVFIDKKEYSGDIFTILENIQNGRSEARNKVIANVFKELGLIEQWGSGINRIKTICKEKGLQEPKIQEQNDFVDVEFYRPTNEELNKVTIDKIYYNRLRPITTDYDRLNTDEQKVLKYLHENKKITRKDAVQLLGYGETKIKETLNILLEKELIIRIGQGRSTYYEYNYSIDN